MNENKSIHLFSCNFSLLKCYDLAVFCKHQRELIYVKWPILFPLLPWIIPVADFYWERKIPFISVMPRHSLEQLAARRIFQIIVYFSGRSRKLAQQDQFWKRYYEYIQNSVHSWVWVLYFQCLCFGRKWWLRLMLVHIHQNWCFLDCLFKQHLWCSFQLASQGLQQMVVWWALISTVIWKVHLEIIALLQTAESRGNIIRIIYLGQSKCNPWRKEYLTSTSSKTILVKCYEIKVLVSWRSLWEGDFPTL